MKKTEKIGLGIENDLTLYELVSENGVPASRNILQIVSKLCRLLSAGGKANEIIRSVPIHPKNIILTPAGDIKLKYSNLQIFEAEKYLAPELSPSDYCTPRALVYSIGMLMLFMATGQEEKAKADSSLQDRHLLFLIETCTAFDPNERFRDINELAAAIDRNIGLGKSTLLKILKISGVIVFIFLIMFSWMRGKALGSAKGEESGFEPGYIGGYEQGFNDSPGVKIRGAALNPKNGNLSGNLISLSGPTTAFSDESVFFISENKIVEMDAYTGEKRIIVSKPGIYCLQYYEGKLYYCAEEKIFSIDPNNLKDEIFCDSRGGLLYIFDNVFYLYDNRDTGYLYKINPKDRTLIQLNGAMKYKSLNVVDGKLYYIDPERGNCIFRSDLDGGNASIISSSSYESFCVYDGKLYVGTDNGLMRMELNGGNPEYLTLKPSYSPIVSDGGIFFLSGTGRTLAWISADGKIEYTVVPTRTGTFSLGGQWIIYTNEDDGGSLWHVRASGADNAKASE